MFPVWTLFLLLLCYILGAVPFGSLVARQLAGIDLKKHGSGNTGAANAFRALGWKGGLLVLALDVLKGTVAVWLAYFTLLPNFLLPFARIGFGMAAIVGHNYSIFQGFKGGKGVATSLGVLLAISPKVALLAVLLWVGLVGLTRYSSVGSLGATAAVPVLMVVYGDSLIYVAFAFCAAAMTFHRHRANIERLRAGQELRIDDRTLPKG